MQAPVCRASSRTRSRACRSRVLKTAISASARSGDWRASVITGSRRSFNASVFSMAMAEVLQQSPHRKSLSPRYPPASTVPSREKEPFRFSCSMPTRPLTTGPVAWLFPAPGGVLFAPDLVHGSTAVIDLRTQTAGEPLTIERYVVRGDGQVRHPGLLEGDP